MNLIILIGDRPSSDARILPIETGANPTLKPHDQKDNVNENVVDTDGYDLEDCSAQEYEIMKVRTPVKRFLKDGMLKPSKTVWSGSEESSRFVMRPWRGV